MSSVCIQVINPNTSLAMTETIGAAARAALRRAPRSLRSPRRGAVN
jgi:allantoin racemase